MRNIPFFGNHINEVMRGLVAQYGVDYLQQYPWEYVSLRRDLAKSMLLDLNLFDPTANIMKALAATETPLPPSVLQAALGLSDEQLHQGISQATSAGLIVPTDGKLGVHPLIADHFWNLLHRENYALFLGQLATVVHSYAMDVGVGSSEFSLLVPVVFKLYAASGQWERARSLRSDLQGEIERAAIFHYRRRNYDLAWEYVKHALDGANPSWLMRLYQARILIRKESWAEADEVLERLLQAKPRDLSTLHAKGWSLLRQKRHEEALATFAKVISQREHVASLRDSAACLHELNRIDEALEFLRRAKAVEIDNPFVLDLEARILEERGELESAYQAAYVAMVRDPNNWAFHHRLGRIRIRQGQLEAGIEHLRTAVGLDQDQFTPRHALIAGLLDLGDVPTAESLLEELSERATTITNHALVEHLKARVLIVKGNVEEAAELLEGEITRNRNLLPNLGLYAEAKLRQSIQLRPEFPATSTIEFERAANAVSRGLGLDGENGFLLELQDRIDSMRSGAADGT